MIRDLSTNYVHYHLTLSHTKEVSCPCPGSGASPGSSRCGRHCLRVFPHDHDTFKDVGVAEVIIIGKLRSFPGPNEDRRVVSLESCDGLRATRLAHCLNLGNTSEEMREMAEEVDRNETEETGCTKGHGLQEK